MTEKAANRNDYWLLRTLQFVAINKFSREYNALIRPGNC